jgi:hypothetical protein
MVSPSFKNIASSSMNSSLIAIRNLPRRLAMSQYFAVSMSIASFTRLPSGTLIDSSDRPSRSLSTAKYSTVMRM